MKRDLRFSRRELLKSIGAGMALLPLLESDPADAQCLSGGIKRLYILVWPDGMLSSGNSWSAAGTDPSNWQLAPFQASLQPYQSDLLLLNGVDYKFLRDGPHSETTGHACFPGMLTGALYQSAGSSTANDVAGGPSIDQFIGSKLKAGGYGGLVSLNQGAFVQSTARISWSAAGKAVIPDLDPYHVFTTYIQGKISTPPSSGTGGLERFGGLGRLGGGSTVDRAKLAQKSILDYVIADLNRFGKVVGTADKASIDAHLTYVRDIEKGLGAVGTGGASGAGGSGGMVIPGSGAACAHSRRGDRDPRRLQEHRQHPRGGQAPHGPRDRRICRRPDADCRHADRRPGRSAADPVVVTAQLQVRGAEPGDANTGDVNGFHAIAHRNVADKVACDTWFQSQVAYVIGQMKTVVDPSGKSMLDSSVVVGMNNMRTGTHETSGVPVVMAGSCGGYFKTGRSLKLPAGTPNNGLLVALCNAMGANTDTFGAATYGGELTVLKG